VLIFIVGISLNFI